jgi:hypothetical protein
MGMTIMRAEKYLSRRRADSEKRAPNIIVQLAEL